jgi:hypothetical protein
MADMQLPFTAKTSERISLHIDLQSPSGIDDTEDATRRSTVPTIVITFMVGSTLFLSLSFNTDKMNSLRFCFKFKLFGFSEQ